MDGADYTDVPAALQPMRELRALNIQPQGTGKPLILMATPGGKLLFAQDGYAAFGKITIGDVPGSISVSVDHQDVFASLDGSDDVALPHLFEYVLPGDHKVVIREVRVKTPAIVGGKFFQAGKILAGVEQKVTVTPGTQAKVNLKLDFGKAKLRVEGIPQESNLQIDGEDRLLTMGTDGKQFFEGDVNAGITQVNVAHGGIVWEIDPMIPTNSSQTIPLKSMRLSASLQRLNITFRGKDEDFAGVYPIFNEASKGGPLQRKLTPGMISGPLISGSVCRDYINLYIKIDFSNLKPLSGSKDCAALVVHQNGDEYWLQVTKHSTAINHRKNWVWETFAVVGSHMEGSSFIEMQFPLLPLSKIFDFSKPINAYLYFGSATASLEAENNQTDEISILIGK